MTASVVRKILLLLLAALGVQYALSVLKYIPYIGSFLSELVPLARLFLYFGIGVIAWENIAVHINNKSKSLIIGALILIHIMTFSSTYVYSYLNLPIDIKVSLTANKNKVITYKEAKDIRNTFIKDKVGLAGIKGYFIMELTSSIDGSSAANSFLRSTEDWSGLGDVISTIINLILDVVPILIEKVLSADHWGGLIYFIWWYLITGVTVGIGWKIAAP